MLLAMGGLAGNLIQKCSSDNTVSCTGNIPGMLLAMGGLAGNLILQQLLAAPTTG